MPGSSTNFQDFWVDSLTIVADAQSQMVVIVTDLDFDKARGGVTKRISDYLTSNPVDLILNGQDETARFSLDGHAKTCKVGRVQRADIGRINRRSCE